MLILGIVVAATVPIVTRKSDNDGEAQPSSLPPTTAGGAFSAKPTTTAPATTTPPYPISTPSPTAHPTVYHPSNNTVRWEQLGLDIPAELQGKSSSYESKQSVALSRDGSILAVGAPGSGIVRAFAWSRNATWEQMGSDLLTLNTHNYSHKYSSNGWAVALSNDGLTLATGAPSFQIPDEWKILRRVGKVSIYRWNETDWIRLGKPIEGKPMDEAGYAVALSGNGSVVAVGCPRTGENQGVHDHAGGYTRVYDWDARNETWVQRGGDIETRKYPELARDGAALSPSDDGSIVAVGSGDEWALSDSGVTVSAWNGYEWQIRDVLRPEKSLTHFGKSVSMSADASVLAIGAPFYATGSGRAYVYAWNGTSYETRGTSFPGERLANFGRGIALTSDGSTLAIGCPSCGELWRSGIVLVYQWNDYQQKWIQYGPNITGLARELLGFDIAISDNASVLACAAPHKGVAKAYQLRTEP